MAFKVFERSYGAFDQTFATEAEAQAFLDADEYYDPGDMTIWIEEI